MTKSTAYIKWFDKVDRDDVNLVGGKGANLGEMIKADLPVPEGYIVTAQAYFEFIKQTGIREKIVELLRGLDVNKSDELATAAKNVRQLILKTQISPEIKNSIISAYQRLSQGKPTLVAIRSSATAEDLPEASFAGQQESYMNIQGKEEVVTTIQHAWASLFEDRAVFYRQEKGFDHLKVGIAVPVQRMIQSEASGVLFTADPISNDQKAIVIEAGYGFGDAVVSGSITPDQYRINKQDLEIVNKTVVKQTRMLARSSGNLKNKDAKAFKEGSQLFWVPVPKKHQEKQKISDQIIKQLAELGKRIESHYQHPQDIEWAVENNKPYIVQTRPITTLDLEPANLKQKTERVDLQPERSVGQAGQTPTPNTQTHDGRPDPLLDGLGASPGIAVGPVKIIKSAAEIGKIKEGDILVTEMTTPDFVPAMRRAVAVVTNLGGRTSHAAIVSRELGIPAIVGTEQATQLLKNGEVVTVDGKLGQVYQGKLEISEKKEQQPKTSYRATRNKQTPTDTRTATKIYSNLGEPQLAEEIAKRDVDGVGLLRAEFMIANIGEHPRYMLENNRRNEFVDKLYEGIFTFAKAFDPRPVIYRTTDFRTNEYRGLKGGQKFEEEEANPMIGFRGVSRYIDDPEVFRMELEAIREVRRDHKNIWVMLPFVRTPEELKTAKKIMSGMGLYQSGTFNLFIMVEVPSTVVMLDKFIGVGIDGASIGSNDLTQLMLGVDRDNAKIANSFDERDPAVLWALKKTIKTCQEHGIYSSICGQAPSQYPELVPKLVRWGISSISVSPDVIDRTRKLVADAEFDKVRGRL